MAGALLVLFAAYTSSEERAHWVPFVALPGVVDLTATRRDGRLTATAAGRLFLVAPAGTLEPFAREPGGYAGNPGFEAYLALAHGRHVRGARCAFRRDDVYVLDVMVPGVVVVETTGQARRMAELPAGTFPNGIAFDEVGRFGRRLLVTAGIAGGTDVFAIDCRGKVRTIVEHAPAMEGGISVAPRSFGRFRGQLIAPDEISGRVLAIDARGTVRTVVESGLASGGDIGVESTGFVPNRFGRRGAAYLADRGSPGNILTIPGAALFAAGVRPGDLLVATEGGAETIAVRCGKSCTVRRVADGPEAAHAEGHIVFGLD